MTLISVRKQKTKKMIYKFKILILSTLPSKLPKRFLILYWLLISRFQGLILNCDFIESIKEYQGKNSNKLYLLKMSDGDILIQDLSRVSRFLKGLGHATSRLWRQYIRFEEELNNSVSVHSEKFTVFDIGANVGEFAIAAAKKFPNSIIYAFEPDPTVNECLQFNIESMKLNSNIKCMRLALSNTSGVNNFYIATAGADSSFIEPPQYTAIEKVECIIGYEFMLENRLNHINLLKMDAEGFEPEILNGFGEYIFEIDFLAIDVSPERLGMNTKSEVSTILASSKFIINSFTDKNNRQFINSFRNKS